MTAARDPLTVLGAPAFRNRETNPYNSLLYTALRARGVRVEEFSLGSALRLRPEVVHLHWPELQILRPTAYRTLVRAGLLLLLLAYLRARGSRIVWTMHNLRAHEPTHPRVEDRFWARFVRLVDGVISLSGEGLRLARERYPALEQVPGFVVPHGHYREAYPQGYTRAMARERLGLHASAPALLYFGQLRRYKGIPELLRTFRGVSRPDAILSVVGRIDDAALAQELRQAAAQDVRIRLVSGFATAEAVALELAAADLVLLPYSQVLNSGSALLALSQNRPVLVPRIGSLEELQRMVGDSWVNTFDPPLTPAVLARAMDWAAARREDRCDLSALEWPLLAEQTLAAYRTILDRPRGREAPNAG